MRPALALLLATLPVCAAKPTPAQLQAQVKRLTEERDDLKQRLAAAEELRQELTTAQKARDAAKAETEAARKEADRLKALLKENQGGGEAILRDLQEARRAAEVAQAEAERLRGEAEALRKQVATAPKEGDLVQPGEEVQPARPLNLARVTPRVKSSGMFGGRPKGVVVVGVLISEKGDVLASRLIQGLPGDAPEAREAGEACVEAAKRLVFDPAASKDGKLRFKVWQGVGFYLD